MESILRMVRAGGATWVSSAVLEIQINRNPDVDRRHDVAKLLALPSEIVVPQSTAAERAVFFQKLRFDLFDALLARVFRCI